VLPDPLPPNVIDARERFLEHRLQRFDTARVVIQLRKYEYSADRIADIILEIMMGEKEDADN
tara:strand:+ start:423 stop:608 length:186 start_codon:yes stop_codon:yes gene_type:complete